jgi:CRISPR system Cascade subunit CasC
MTDRFLQLHLLTFYPPSNPNRDDASRPKTCIVGGVERLRLSSQAIKRAVRTSEAFEAALVGSLGSRTARIGDLALEALRKRGLDDAVATKRAAEIASVFGKANDDIGKPAQRIKQLAFVSPIERDAAVTLAESLDATAALDADQTRASLLQRADHAVDIALFGRMFADSPGYNREAAAQVAHSFTTHAVVLDDDYYTAVDDLKKPEEEDAGAGFIGNLAFGSGVHYLYVCVDRGLLSKNLGADAPSDLAPKAVRAFVEAFATTSPGGKRKAFGHNPRASYVLAERGDAQPRSLAIAYLRPVKDDDLMAASIDRIEKARDKLEKAYGPSARDHRVFDAYRDGHGDTSHRAMTLADLSAFAAGD